jgi:AcrR family transcriptional regulator
MQYVFEQCQVSGHNFFMATTQAPRKSYHHGDLEAALISTALIQIKKYGPGNLSLREVASEVGVSPSAAYHYFPDKESLVRAIAEKLFADLAKMEEEAVQSIPGNSALAARKRFRAIGNAYYKWAKKQPHSFQLMFGGFCNIKDEAGFEENAAFQLLTKTLDDLVDSGAMPKSSRNGGELLAWSSVHGATNLIIEGHLPEEAIELVLDGIERGLSIR